MVYKSHSSNGWVFPLSSWVFCFFSFDVLRLSCWGCLASNHPVLQERKSTHVFLKKCPGESSGWYDANVSPWQRMEERFEWIQDIIWHQFWKTPGVLQWLKHWNNASSTVIIRQIIADLPQIRFFLQVVRASNQCLHNRIRRPMWRPMSFSPAKKSVCVFFPLTIVLRNTVIVRLAVCTSIVSMFFHVFIMFFHIFHIGQTSWSSPCYDKFLTPKGVHL